MGSEVVGERGGDGEKSYWGVDSKRCDSCRNSAAILFCRADSAFLCSPCDARIHNANKLASRHERMWLCEVCEQAPAAVTCKADAAALCLSCDADIHSANPLARRHERIPIVLSPASFNHRINHNKMLSDDSSPSIFDVVDISSSGAVHLQSGSDTNCFFSDAADDPYLDLDYTDSVVPVQQQPTSAPVLGFPSRSTYSVCSSEVGVVPDGATNAGHSNNNNKMMMKSGVGMMDREARVTRYREKRKKRRFEKTVRYASRKAYAETRPRIKGRFAKRSTEFEVQREDAAGGVIDGSYGVVPSF